MITFIIFYFSGMVLAWIIEILFMKYHKELVTNKCDLDKALDILLVTSVLSWIVVVAATVIFIMDWLKQFIYNIFGNWILKDKEDF